MNEVRFCRSRSGTLKILDPMLNTRMENQEQGWWILDSNFYFNKMYLVSSMIWIVSGIWTFSCLTPHWNSCWSLNDISVWSAHALLVSQNQLLKIKRTKTFWSGHLCCSFTVTCFVIVYLWSGLLQLADYDCGNL